MTTQSDGSAGAARPPSPLEKYRRISDAVFAFYETGQQRDALAVLDDAGPELAPWQAELAHLRACLHGSLGERDEAFTALERAHHAGGWWDPSILVEDDDLASLADLPAFVSLVEACRAHWAEANARLDRTGDRLVLPSGPTRGVLVALHGADEDADDAVAAWGSATVSSFAVLAVRSSQRTSPSYRSWPDRDRAAAEVADALATLPEETQGLPLVAAGFSAGGRVALQWALSGDPCAVAGLIAVAPAIRADLAGNSLEALSPAILLVGADDDLHDDVVAAGQTVGGLTVDVVEGLGHRFPDDFPRRLSAALDQVDH